MDRRQTLKKTRICVVVPSHYGALLGGAEYQVKLLVEHLLATEAYEVFYLARFATERSAAHYTVVKIGGVPYLRRFAYIFDAFNLLAALKSIRPDVIYQRVGCAYTGICAYYAKRYHCPMIWHIASDMDVSPQPELRRPTTVHKASEKKLLEYGIRNVTAIVAQTKHQAELLETHYYRRATTIIRNFQPPPKETCAKGADIVRVVWVANFKRMKHPEVFLQLAQDFSDTKGVEFVMVGQPASEHDWQVTLNQRIARLNNLQYLGGIQQDEVNVLLARSDVLVNTSDYEGFSNTFIQAWMRSVAVLSLRVNPDGAFDGDRLGICAGGEYRHLRSSLMRLIEDSALRRSIAERAQQEAVRNHSLANVTVLVRTIGNVVEGAATGALPDVP